MNNYLIYKNERVNNAVAMGGITSPDSASATPNAKSKYASNTSRTSSRESSPGRRSSMISFNTQIKFNFLRLNSF